jgi:hypothetical protein
MSTAHHILNAMYAATDLYELAELAGGHIGPLGTMVHGAAALGHLGLGITASTLGPEAAADALGPENTAQHHYAEAALNGIEAIPFVGTGVSIANLISQYDGTGMDALPDVMEKWMFGEKQQPVRPRQLNKALGRYAAPATISDEEYDASWAELKAMESREEDRAVNDYDYRRRVIEGGRSYQ